MEMYNITNMNEDSLREIISWEYEGEYAKYNMDSYDKLKERNASILDINKRDNYLCYYNNGELVGYTNIVKRTNGELFLGIGLAPKFCGKGLGKDILIHTINVAKERHAGLKICLEVRLWNKRAIKCYEKAGFKYIKTEVIKDRNDKDTEFVFMEYSL